MEKGASMNVDLMKRNQNSIGLFIKLDISRTLNLKLPKLTTQQLSGKTSGVRSSSKPAKFQVKTMCVCMVWYDTVLYTVILHVLTDIAF